LAVEQAGWAIKYVSNPSEELQLIAVRKNYDAIKFIKEPYESVQKEAVSINYEALRFIKAPTYETELIAICSNEAAIKFVKKLDKNKMLEFLKANILVIKYIGKDISKEELVETLKEVLSNETVEDKYVRDFINYNSIDHTDLKDMDKILFIYKYGSKMAKKIAVDEKLKM
jgi:hypothetical protein